MKTLYLQRATSSSVAPLQSVSGRRAIPNLKLYARNVRHPRPPPPTPDRGSSLQESLSERNCHPSSEIPPSSYRPRRAPSAAGTVSYARKRAQADGAAADSRVIEPAARTRASASLSRAPAMSHLQALRRWGHRFRWSTSNAKPPRH